MGAGGRGMTLSSSQGDLTKMTAPARPMFRPVPQAKNRTLYGTRRLALWVRSLSATSAELARRLWTGSPLARPGALPLAGPGAIPPTLLQSACRHLCVDDEQGLKVWTEMRGGGPREISFGCGHS